MIVRTLYDLDLELADHPETIHVPAGTRLKVERTGVDSLFGDRVFWVRIPGYDGAVGLSEEEVGKVD